MCLLLQIYLLNWHHQSGQALIAVKKGFNPSLFINLQAQHFAGKMANCCNEELKEQPSPIPAGRIHVKTDIRSQFLGTIFAKLLYSICYQTG